MTRQACHFQIDFFDVSMQSQYVMKSHTRCVIRRGLREIKYYDLRIEHKNSSIDTLSFCTCYFEILTKHKSIFTTDEIFDPNKEIIVT